jgi:hypothetical protein
MKNYFNIFLSSTIRRFTIILLLIVCFLQTFSQIRAFKYVSPTESDLTFYKSKTTVSALEKSAIKIEKYLPKNYVKNGEIDYTNYIQKAFSENETILMPNFPILINDNGLILKSNQKIIFQGNSKLILKGSSKSSYSILLIQNVTDVTLYSPQIIGDRGQHLNNVGEWGMGIKISGSKNIKIYNALIKNCWGDGIYISGTPKQNSSNIIIRNCFIDYNQRNGITIVSGENIEITKPIISNTYGKSPMSGIDIEPNNNKAVINNISISDYRSINNSISGLQIGISNLHGPLNKKLNINVSNIYTRDSQCGIIVGGMYDNKKYGRIDGSINISNAKIINSELPIKVGRNYKNGPMINFSNIDFYQSSGSINNKELEKFRYRATSRENISLK